MSDQQVEVFDAKAELDKIVSELREEEPAVEEEQEESASEEITAEQLRGVLGEEAEGIEDEALLELYGKTPDEEREAIRAEIQEETKWDKPWHFVKEEQLLEKIDELSAAELLQLEIESKIDGQAVRRNLDTIVRNAAKVPMQDRRITSLLEQRNAAATRVDELEAQIGQYETDRKLWEKALRDPDTYLKLQEQYQAAMLTDAPEHPAAATDDLEQRGQQIFEAEIKPVIQQLADSYEYEGMDRVQTSRHLEREIEKQFLTMVEAEGRFLTPQRVAEMLQVELPSMIEAGGYQRVGAPAQTPASATPPPEPADSKTAAELANLRAELRRLKLQEAPDSGSGGTAASVNDDPLRDIKSASDMRDKLKDPGFTFGM